MLFANSGMASPLLNPNPVELFDDIDGSGYFQHSANAWPLEHLDLAENTGLAGNTFGGLGEQMFLILPA